MSEPQLIEVLLSNELRSLCTDCAAFEACAYRKMSVKIIIQCELYEQDTFQSSHLQETDTRQGLCMNCSHADTCCLPDKQFGVWRCEEYG
jgi:hypothetical protein